MAVSIFTRDTQVLGPTTTNGSGVAVFNVVCSTTDQIYRIIARGYAVIASAGHLGTCGAWVGEYVISNKNGTLTAVSAVSGSANPDNFSGLVGSRVEAADTSFGTTTGVWTISGTNAVLTITVQSGVSSVAGVSVYVVVDIENCGAT